MVGGGFVRTNYRITGKRIDPGAMKSMIVVDSYYDSYTGAGYITVSMGGYGYPSALMVIGASAMSGSVDGTAGHSLFPTQSFSGSCGWIVAYGSSEVMSGTARVLYAGIIGSR